MNDMMSKYVKGSVMCASNRNLGLYTPLPVPSRPWESVSMDFIGELPMYRKWHDYLYVFVEQFSKICIFMPCKKQITAEMTAHLSFQNVWVHFGLPTSIISDWDSYFLGKFWSYLWELMDTKLKKSTTIFHPHIDGQIEVVNQTMVDLLWRYYARYPKFCDEH